MKPAQDYPMQFRDSLRSTTVLPPTSKPAAARAEAINVQPLRELCPIRMAEAELAEIEVAELCEEISRLHRKPAKVAAIAPRGNSDRPSVPRRRVRKAAAQ